MKALLLDLDDTLLGNSMDDFGPAYLRALMRYVAHLVPPDRLRLELMAGTQAMQENDGRGPTNEEVFAARFYPGVGIARETLEPVLQRFYAEEFPKLSPLTHQIPAARPLVAWACSAGLQVAIATNPLFPLTAIEHRLAWAGVPVTEFDYALATGYETMHATKSSPAYYLEIAARLGRQPAECLMVGDDWGYDVRPAAAAGMPVYWIAPAEASRPDPGLPLAGQGTLAELLAQLTA